MTSSTSSAEWPKLYNYSDRALQIDRELAAEANRIAGILRNFEATCTEYRVSVSHLAGEIQGYASRAEGTDVWVRQVGVAFQQADISSGVLWSIFHVDRKFLDVIWEFAKARGVFKSHLLTIGRLFNQISGRGHVGKMDDLYNVLAKGIPHNGSLDRLLSSKIAQGGFIVVGVVLDVFEDINKGKYDSDIVKIVGVDTTNAGIQLGIAGTGVGAIVLLVNTGVQIVGSLQAAVQHTMADIMSVDLQTRSILLDDANRIENAVDRMDLTNITKEVSEVVYDIYLAPYADLGKVEVRAIQQVWSQPSFSILMKASEGVLEAAKKDLPTIALNALSPISALMRTPENRAIVGQGALDAVKVTGNILDGALDWYLSTGFSTVNLAIVAADRAIIAVPVPADLKIAVDNTLREWLQRSQDNARWFVNLIKID